MILITGCNGLIGSFIARKFLREGYSIRAIRRQKSNMQLVKDIEHAIEWVEGDILDPLFLTKALTGIDTVIHAAAIVSFSPADHENMFKVNIEGTSNIVNACLTKNIRKLYYISSIAALGRNKQSSLINEEAQWESSAINSVYAETKHLAELEVWRGIAEGLQAVIVNPSIVLGPGDWDKSSTRLFKYIWEENPFYTEGCMNYVDVRDVADIIFRLINSEISSERFILNAGSISFRELFNKIAEQLEKKKPSIHIMPWMAAIAWRIERLRSLLTGSNPLITQETALLAQTSFAYDNSKIRRTLPYTFRNLDDSIAWTCTELKNRLNVTA